jgi:hypothetical protein
MNFLALSKFLKVFDEGLSVYTRHTQQSSIREVMEVLTRRRKRQRTFTSLFVADRSSQCCEKGVKSVWVEKRSELWDKNEYYLFLPLGPRQFKFLFEFQRYARWAISDTKVDRHVENSLNNLSESIQIRFQRRKEQTDWNSIIHDQISLSMDSESFMQVSRAKSRDTLRGSQFATFWLVRSSIGFWMHFCFNLDRVPRLVTQSGSSDPRKFSTSDRNSFKTYFGNQKKNRLILESNLF